jgi:hypothetical protein
LKYVFDNDISYRLVDMLAALDVDAEPLRAEFPPDTKDPVFLEKFSGREMVWISKNTKQTTNPIEGMLLKQAGITALYFGPFWNKMKFWQQAEWLVKHWPIIDGFAKGATKGTFAEIKRNGKSETFQI